MEAIPFAGRWETSSSTSRILFRCSPVFQKSYTKHERKRKQSRVEFTIVEKVVQKMPAQALID
jgi:hypothetical protein